MSGKRYIITEVRHEWTDNRRSYWVVFYHMDGSTPEEGWWMFVRANDELAAYVEATRKLDGAS